MPKYSSVKLKVNLQLSIQRLKALQKKHDNQNILARKEVAELLRRNKNDLAKIKVESIIRDDYYQEALEILETYCSLVLTRFGLIESVRYCDAGIRKAVCTIIWSTPRVSVDVTEFKEIKKQFTLRYGKEFADAALQDVGKEVCPRVSQKLSFVVPEERLVHSYLQSIAEFYNVEFTLAPPTDDLAALEAFANTPDFRPPGSGFDGNTGGHGGIGGDLIKMDHQSPPPAQPTDLTHLAFPPMTSPPASYPPQQMYPPQQPSQPMSPPSMPSPPDLQPPFDPSADFSFPIPPSIPSGPPTSSVSQPPSYADSNSSGLRASAPPAPDVDPFPSVPSADDFGLGLPTPPGMQNSVSAGTESDLDDLAARFNALKK
jgi:vacuolar protein sorting-associated protein IST1